MKLTSTWNCTVPVSVLLAQPAVPHGPLLDSLRASTPAHPFPTGELRDPVQPEPVRRTGVSVWALGAGELQGLVALGASAFRGLGRPPHRGARLSPQLSPHLSQSLPESPFQLSRLCFSTQRGTRRRHLRPPGSEANKRNLADSGA